MEESESIFEAVMRFRRSRSPRHLLAALRMIVTKRRSMEVLYGAWSFVMNRPGPLSPDGGLDIHETLRRANDLYQGNRMLQLRSVERALESCRFRHRFEFRNHPFQSTNHGITVGEYGEGYPRILISTGDEIVWQRLYESERGVRHIHVVMEYRENTFVTTGDSTKFVDQYSLNDGVLRLQRRVMRHLGGFSAACVVDGDCWFGSDFSGRPNYLLNFRSRKKHYFPGAAFRQFCDLILPIDNRLLICLNKDLTNLRTISMFDIHRGVFVFSEALPGNRYF